MKSIISIKLTVSFIFFALTTSTHAMHLSKKLQHIKRWEELEQFSGSYIVYTMTNPYPTINKEFSPTQLPIHYGYLSKYTYVVGRSCGKRIFRLFYSDKQNITEKPLYITETDLQINKLSIRETSERELEIIMNAQKSAIAELEHPQSKA